MEERLYTAEEVRRLDQAAMNGGIPGLVLMERAGEAVAAAIEAHWPDWRRFRVGVLAGGGNNGGDGYVVARRLRELGGAPELIAAADPGRLRGDAAHAAERWRDAGGDVHSVPDTLAGYDLLVDALLGTGLDREVRSPYRELIEEAAACPAPVVAVDIPSGLNADTGRVLGAAAPAEVTVTFVGLKRGLFTGDGPGIVGEVRYEGLGIPEAIRSEVPVNGRRLTVGPLRQEPRPANAHKGHFGRVVVAGGAPGTTGAAVMAGWSALRSGAGWVVCCLPPETSPLATAHRPELMTAVWDPEAGLPAELGGGGAVAVGPGLGRSDAARRVLEAALARPVPLVIDADGLSLLAEHDGLRDALDRRGEPTVLTPHPGEAARLLGCDSGSIQEDRFGSARRITEKYNAVCCLKGAGTIIQAPDGQYAVSPTGNPGMSMAGQGDILTGVLAAQLAQNGGAPLLATCRAVWAHGRAADRVAQERGPFGYAATECADALPGVWRELTNYQGHEPNRPKRRDHAQGK
ncbi:NAD(P)H-hydrate dehydratase [Thiohalorhabdus methylotrophus]|uniref:Bifunctional NAD(P)H-hydrate repair enzyme n=1 Tax=Thiohalorhabdus methylotrophus TaxID=3242694 RepID=A0ABV4TY96_9GAMM